MRGLDRKAFDFQVIPRIGTFLHAEPRPAAAYLL